MFKRTIVAVITFAALLCSGLTVNAAKPTQWLIYWYVCGTDLETKHIEFKPGTDLMSDDPNALILAEPNRKPGNMSRSINEVEAAELSPDVKIFMQAGGTYVWGHKKFRVLNAKIQTGLGQGNFIGNGNGFYEQWHLNDPLQPNTLMSNGKIGRYLYDKYHRNWIPRERPLPITDKRGALKTLNNETDMGSQAGLKSFLQAGQKLEQSLYPDGNVRRVFIFVDHGGGTFGICKDEYTGNMLSLQEVRDAFAEVKNGWTNPEEKPFEVVAFDACLMSTYETAVALENVANYMVASQETTWSYVGLGYTELLNTLSKNPAMSGAELGKVICDTYWDDSKATDQKFDINSNVILTEAVIDLSAGKMDALKTAYANFGNACKNFAQQNSADFVQTLMNFNKAANRAEKYPSEASATSFSDYTAPWQVDLRGFAENVSQNLPELKDAGSELVSAVNSSVIYKKRGNALNSGGGLSTYYPFDLLGQAEKYDGTGKIIDTGNILRYQQLAVDKLAPESQSALYYFLYQNVRSQVQPNFVPVIDPNTKQPLYNQETKLPLVQHKGWKLIPGGLFDLSRLANVPVSVDVDKKTVRIELSAENRKNIDSVRCQLSRIITFKDSDGTDKIRILYLGGNSDITENSDTGEFESTFNGKWITFEGHPVYVQVVSDATKRNKHGKKVGGHELCSIPVLLNNQVCNLFVSHQYPSEKITIIGAAPPSSGSGIPSGSLLGLNKGDVVTPIYSTRKAENTTLEAFYGTPIEIGDKAPKIEFGSLADGEYLYSFEFVNPIGWRIDQNAFTNQGGIFTMKDCEVVNVRHT